MNERVLTMVSEAYNLAFDIKVSGSDVIKMAHVQARLQSAIEELSKETNTPVEYEQKNNVYDDTQ